MKSTELNTNAATKVKVSHLMQHLLVTEQLHMTSSTDVSPRSFEASKQQAMFAKASAMRYAVGPPEEIERKLLACFVHVVSKYQLDLYKVDWNSKYR
ncbi:hypothetical protein EB796_010562 [Bugula neritina]|uniref:Uncharacterized protein n=1 Tax=Bugula neritina TaxID=10212 RepID=A0A7J7JXQ0_BUGNE|nr:hypothetical protein EB796_010562 [Bugula neritina]